MDQRICSFCNKPFRCLGKQLGRCPERQDQPYHQYLSQIKESSLTQHQPNPLKKCPHCGVSFKQLDVHLRWNAACRDPLADKSSLDAQLQQSQHRELFSDAKLAQQQSAQNQHVQHTDIFYQNVQYTSKGNQSSSDQPHLKPALKLSPSNAIDDCANFDLSQKAVLLVEKTYDYFAQRFGTINCRLHRFRRRQRRFNRAMAQLRDQKNEVRRKYRAALRDNQPKETIVNWLVLTIAWLGSITESGDRKNHSTCSPECRKIETIVQRIFGSLRVSCWMMTPTLGRLHLSLKQKPLPFSGTPTPVNANNHFRHQAGWHLVVTN